MDREAVAATRTAIARYREWDRGAAARQAAHRIATMVLDTVRNALIDVDSGAGRINDGHPVFDDDVTRAGRDFFRLLVQQATSDRGMGKAVDPAILPAALAELAAGRDASGDKLNWTVVAAPHGNAVSDLYRGTGYAAADRDAGDVADLIAMWASDEQEPGDDEISRMLRNRVGSTEV